MQSNRNFDSYVSAVGPAVPEATGRAVDYVPLPTRPRREQTPNSRKTPSKRNVNQSSSSSQEETATHETYFPHGSNRDAKHQSLTSLYGEDARRILGLTPEQWKIMEVTDELGNGRLVQVGYARDSAPAFELQEIRGLVLDLQAGVKVCPGSEYTEEIVLEEPVLDIQDFTPEEYEDQTRVKPEMRAVFDKKGRLPRKLVVKSVTLGEDVEFDVETDATIRNRLYSQGTNIKIFLHNGRVHVITNNNLDPSGEVRNERWRNLWDSDPKFRELFADRGRNHTQKKAAFPQNATPFTDDFFRILGFPVTDFYPEGCLYSPYTYSFLLTVPHSVTSSRVVFPRAGYLTFIRKEGTWRKLWQQNPELCPFKESEADSDEVSTFYMGTPDYDGVDVEQFFTSKKGELFTDVPLFGDSTGEAFVTFPRTNLSLGEAEGLIKYGYLQESIVTPAGQQLLDDCLQFDKKRNFLGEAIILTKRVKRQVVNPFTGETTTKSYFYSVQIQPPGFAWRHKFFHRRGDGDMYKLFVDALSVYSEGTKELNYANLLTYFPAYQIKEFIGSFLVYWDRSGEKPPVDNPLIPSEYFVPPSETAVISTMFAILRGGSSFCPRHYIPAQDPKLVSKERYNKALDVITPYFIMMMNPIRQQDVIKYYKRYTSQLKLLAGYIVNNPAHKLEKGGPYYTSLDGAPINELFTFANKCTNYSKANIPNFGSEGARVEFMSNVVRQFERESGERKIDILQQVTLKHGPEKLREMMEITKVGSGEINLARISFVRPSRRVNKPKTINPKTGQREFKKGAGPVGKAAAPSKTRNGLRKK